MAGFLMRQTKWLVNQAGANTTARAKYILFKVADLLVDTGKWELDRDHHPNQNKEEEYMSGNSNKVFALFLKSTVFETGHTPEKLMIGYSIGLNVIPAPFGFAYSSSEMCNLDGLFTSMIPADSSQVFGQTWMAEGFIPTDASLVCSSTRCDSIYRSYNMAAAFSSSTDTFHAQIVTNGHIVLFRMYKNSNYGTIWFVGPAIGTLAHPTVDVRCTAKMLNMHITKADLEGSGGANSYNSGFFYDYVDSNRVNQYNQIEFCAADGTHIQSNNSHGIFYDSSSTLNSERISNSSITGFNRWTAIYIGVHSSDPTTHYVVMGDGMKGYLDTNFLRHVRTSYSFGQTFDDGNFVYIGFGLALGWDPSNGTLQDA